MADENIGQASTAQPQENAGNTSPTVQNNDGWDDAKFNSIAQKYKGDPKEIGKALWSQQKEFTKLQQELQTLKTNSTKSSPTTNSNESTQQQNNPSDPQKQSTQQKVEAVQSAGPKPHEVVNSAYVEVFETGKLTENSLKALQNTLGLDQTDTAIFAEAMSSIVQKRMKEAQAYVDVDVKELKKFAEAEGNFTDPELIAIQEALNKGMYGVLKDVEKKYKSSHKKTVEHGTVSTAVSGQGLTYEQAEALKADVRYGRDRNYSQMVMEQINAADKSGWMEQVRQKYSKGR